MNLEIKEFEKDKFIFIPEGIMDTQNSQMLENEILNKIYSSKDVCEIKIDLIKASYITSLFIRVCVSAKRHNKVEKFSVINASKDVFKIFKMTDLVDKLNVSE